MKTKENAFTLPVMITLYEFCFFSRFTSHVSRFLYLIPILLTLLIVPLTLMSISGSHQLDPGSYGAKVFSRSEYLFTQFRVIVKYLSLLFFPVDQNAAYYYPVFKSFFDPQVILSFLFLAALFGLGVCMVIKTREKTKENDSGQAGMTKKERESRLFGLPGIVSRFTAHVSRPLPGSRFTIHDSRSLRLIGFGILWFFITLSVESSIIPLPMLLDEYRVYLPSVGLIISVVTGVFWIFSRFTPPPPIPPPQRERVREEGRVSPFTIHYSRVLLVVLVVAVGVLSVTAYLRNEVWGDRIRLWEDIVKKSPGNVRAHDKLGSLYIQEKLYDKAIDEINIVIGMSPYYADSYRNLGIIYQARNMYAKAIEEYLTALSLNPTLAEAHNNLGVCYKTLKMFDKAIEQYMIALKLKPDYADAHNNLGLIYLTLNMPDKAVSELQTGVNLAPTDVKAHFYLGDAYLSLNMPDKAMEQYLITVNLRPDYVEAHNNLGGIYQAFNMLDKAVDQLQIVIKLKPDYAEAHFNLGALYYRMGQTDNARTELITGLKIKPEDQQAQQLLETVNR
jgi:tetratricopeptide (TPR) repeat protein